MDICTMIIAKNDMGTTSFHKDESLLVSNYIGRVKLDLVVEHLSNIIIFYQNNPGSVKRSVVDISKVLGSFAKVLEFLEENYYIEAVRSGLKCQAYVASEDLIIKNLSVRLEMLALKFNIKSKVFSSLEEAKIWVKETI